MCHFHCTAWSHSLSAFIMAIKERLFSLSFPSPAMDSSFDADIPITVEGEIIPLFILLLLLLIPSLAFDQSSPSTSVLVTPGDWDFTSTSSSLVKRSNSSCMSPSLFFISLSSSLTARLWSKRGRQAFRRDSRPPNIKISAQHSVPQSPLTAPELDYEWAIPASSSPRRRSSSFRSHRPCSSISSTLYSIASLSLFPNFLFQAILDLPF